MIHFQKRGHSHAIPTEMRDQGDFYSTCTRPGERNKTTGTNVEHHPFDSDGGMHTHVGPSPVASEAAGNRWPVRRDEGVRSWLALARGDESEFELTEALNFTRIERGFHNYDVAKVVVCILESQHLLTVMRILLFIGACLLLSVETLFALHDSPANWLKRRDDAGARAAFAEAYKVFMHPRCVNCHRRVTRRCAVRTVNRMPRSVCGVALTGKASSHSNAPIATRRKTKRDRTCRPVHLIHSKMVLKISSIEDSLVGTCLPQRCRWFSRSARPGNCAGSYSTRNRMVV